MMWNVLLHGEFEAEFWNFGEDVRRNLLAAATFLERDGPKTARPYVDTLTGSKHANMRELRFSAHDGSEVWRALFAFDPDRNALILVAGEKQGVNETLFYKRLIKIADQRFDSHLREIKAATTSKR